MYGPGIGLRDFLPLHTSPPVNESWETIVQKVYGDCSGEEVYDLSADYQRPAVWTAEQMSSFVGFAMTGGTVPTVYCRRIESVENRKTEVVDGKQRIRAICAFIKGHIPASFIHRGKCHEVWWMALDEIDRRCRTLDLSVSYNNWSRVQAMDFYVRLNGAGTPHTPEELERVRNLLLAEEG
jgi:hypothetical protein